MINKNEVRLGNFVKYNNRIFRIDFISNEYPCLDTNEFGVGVVDWDNIKPIKLTEDWLLQFGFEKYWDKDYEYFIGYNENNQRNYDFHIERLNNIFYYCYSDEIDYSIEYVHELQNMFFSLIKKELSFEPVQKPSQINFEVGKIYDIAYLNNYKAVKVIKITESEIKNLKKIHYKYNTSVELCSCYETDFELLVNKAKELTDKQND